jgi:hypothetical protein
MNQELQDLYVHLVCWRQAEKTLSNALQANAHPAHIRILRNMVEKSLRRVRESVDAEPWGAANAAVEGGA